MRAAFALLLAVLATLATFAARAQTPQAMPTPVPAPAAAPAPRDAHEHALAMDFGQLARYAAANQQLPPVAAGEQRVVFYGDSITDAWKLDQYFPGKGYINRGISGQTTPQMLVRYRQDVLDLHPRVVVILAGTNDLSANTGPMTVEQTEENYASLAELARVHGVAVVFSSVMPVNNYMHPEMTVGRPPAKILALNAWLKDYCQANRLVYLDYFAAMVDPAGMLQKPLSGDGLHPNDAGYALIAPLAEKAIAAALAQAPAPQP